MSFVGIVDVASWMPERWMAAAEIGQAAGIPEDVVVERFGLDGKHIAGPHDHVSTMGAAAGEEVLRRAGVDPAEVDVVVYWGSMWKDHLVWSASPRLQDLLGLTNAWAFEMAYVSCGTPVALKVCGDMITADPAINTVLAIGASRESHLLDYSNERSRFMFNFGDGAVAAVLQRDQGHRVAATEILTDGRFSDFVAVFAGGSRNPASTETVAANQHYLDVSDPTAMKEGLDPISGKNFVEVATTACRKAGIELSDLALAVPIHFKRSFFEWIIAELGLSEDRAIYLRRHGHMSGIDPLVGLDLARDRLSPGDWVLLLAAGTGYTWAATVVQW